jgi:hypothetical protein
MNRTEKIAWRALAVATAGLAVAYAYCLMVVL